MKSEFYYSTDENVLDWASAQPLLQVFGPKGALLATIPRPWTPPFVLFPVAEIDASSPNPFDKISKNELQRLWWFCERHGDLILRSSVIGETIWDRGTYESVVIPSVTIDTMQNALQLAAAEVIASAGSRRTAFVLQDYRKEIFAGEFGNLLRVSKTRDHWQVNAISETAGSHETPLNTQRDTEANPDQPLAGPITPTNVRTFGSIAAWINNELLLGVHNRVSCEWLFDGEQVLIVQIDEEG